MTKEISLLNGKYFYLSEYNRLVNSSFKDIFLSSTKKQKVEFRKEDITEETIRKKVKEISQLILEVTEDCNLRCKYCVYNGNYHHQRTFTPRHMSEETAFKGIDYIHSLIKKKKKRFVIGFYGGEPLLKFDLMKEVVKYSKNLFKNRPLTFNFTSNLTIMNDKILDFLLDNKIRIMVSLDGVQENHDAKRVFKDGTGTHATILKNLEKIKQADREYFQKYITFAAVHSYDLDNRKIQNFFQENDLVKDNTMRFNVVNQNETSYYSKYPYEKEKNKKEIANMYTNIFEKLRKKETLKGVELFLYNSLVNNMDAIKSRFLSNTAQTCLFDTRIVIDTYGEFHVCEKVNNKFPFGDIATGFNFGKMAKIATSFVELIDRNCMDCDIQFFCQRCFSTFANDGIFKIPEGFCKRRRNGVIGDLEKYIQIKEEGLI